MNGNSVGLDPEKRILGCISAWLMRIRLIIELNTPKIGGWVSEVPCWAVRWRRTHFQHRLGGGVGKKNFCQSGPRKSHFEMSQRLVVED